MLDADTKRRIDTCRDILVGKVPDPKSQVEQITIALIYKFMDDMDTQAEVLGGKRSFFINGFAQYSWPKLLSPALEGHETLSLYSQAIGDMRKNTHLPALFRDIFKNAYLPYRDPETLRSFLREIDGFTYDHSERLGDAFEYLLSVLGSQGDAGQFRTPRHIIDFMVEVVDPQKNERILDPACGTAGFLISAWKHILANNTDTDRSPVLGNLLNTKERKQLAANIHGYDISPDMVRLSLVNLYLHDFTDPHIDEYDTLTNTERWGEHADVILANPPFMSPKGGIKPHQKFTIKATRSEVLFVDYMAEHLTPEGRAAIIVPEGIIFQSGTAYKKLREMLVKQSLIGVVSLPAGVFNPYSGVKTSILLLDKQRAKRQDKVLFVKIENDGFNLGAQRRPIAQNDLPEAKRLIQAFLHSPETFEGGPLAHAVARERIAASGDWNLSGERYRTTAQTHHTYPMVALGDETVFRIESGGTPKSTEPTYWSGDVAWVTLADLPQQDYITDVRSTERTITESGLASSSAKMLPVGTVLVSSRATIGRVGIARIPLATNQGFKNIIVRDTDRAIPEFVAHMLKRLVPQMEALASGGTFKEISKSSLATLSIPLPPLDIQREIVAEIESYQKIVDGARQVVENYHATIYEQAEWTSVELKDVCTLSSGGTPSKENANYWIGDIPWVSAKDMKTDVISDAALHISEKAVRETATNVAPVGSLLILVRGMGLANGVPICELKTSCAFNQDIKAIHPIEGIDPTFLRISLKQQRAQFQDIISTAGHGTLKIDTDNLLKIRLKMPVIEDQLAVVAEIEAEQALINANKTLITRFEAKIQSVLDRIWTTA
ncbi:N-6 DNA methylase [Ralstonia sp.]|uniref:N-6 DNA methylase n=1 Tax=Ralstonia sp. TaxID=54061 RepID=UPI0031D7894E